MKVETLTVFDVFCAELICFRTGEDKIKFVASEFLLTIYFSATIQRRYIQ